ncbi:hypothetical protein [Nocardiopsis sp. NRRL B-16309]|nr:hypothetical protein [Nocardiopsis sp. NRRL B-16309]
MDAETLIWTLVLFGGTVLAVVVLSYVAWRRESGRADDGEPPPGTEK